MRRVIYRVLTVVIIVPLLPFYGIRQACWHTVTFLDWLIQGRAITTYLLGLIDRLDIWSLQGRRR